MTSSTGVLVAVRLRPNGTHATSRANSVLLDNTTEFKFDKVFDPSSTQNDISSYFVPRIVSSFTHRAKNAKKINISVVAYGQTSSGKTYTMCSESGLVVAVFAELLKHATLRVSAFELYREKEFDLLSDASTLKVTDSGVIGLRECQVTDVSDVLRILRETTERRRVSSTDMNERSSRSHMFVQIRLDDSSTLTFVDLAGSERVSKTGTTGSQLQEGASINNSLMALSSVVSALSHGKKPTTFRNSNLTRVLRNSLTRANNFYMILCCSSNPADSGETRQTLNFGLRAKNMKPLFVTTATTTGAARATMSEGDKDALKSLNFYKDRVSAQEAEIRNLVMRNRLLRIRSIVVEQRLADLEEHDYDDYDYDEDV